MTLTYDEEQDTWRVDTERIDLDNIDLDCLLYGCSDPDLLHDLACDYR